MKIDGADFYELRKADRIAIRRWYSILRIAIYANQEYTGPDRPAYQGCYGMGREEAKAYLKPFAGEIGWYLYLGSK